MILAAVALVAALIGWWGRGHFRDAALIIAEARIVSLRNEVALARRETAIGREVYLKRLAACANCPACTPQTGDPA